MGIVSFSTLENSMISIRQHVRMAVALTVKVPACSMVELVWLYGDRKPSFFQVLARATPVLEMPLDLQLVAKLLYSILIHDIAFEFSYPRICALCC